LPHLIKNNSFTADALWLAASDLDKEAGQFYRPKGTPVDVSTSAPGSPDAFIKWQMTCVSFDIKVGRLRDIDCNKPLGILCEVPNEHEPKEIGE
jgi:hypothetical protein